MWRDTAAKPPPSTAPPSSPHPHPQQPECVCTITGSDLKHQTSQGWRGVGGGQLEAEHPPVKIKLWRREIKHWPFYWLQQRYISAFFSGIICNHTGKRVKLWSWMKQDIRYKKNILNNNRRGRCRTARKQDVVTCVLLWIVGTTTGRRSQPSNQAPALQHPSVLMRTQHFLVWFKTRPTTNHRGNGVSKPGGDLRGEEGGVRRWTSTFSGVRLSTPLFIGSSIRLFSSQACWAVWQGIWKSLMWWRSRRSRRTETELLCCSCQLRLEHSAPGIRTWR